MTDLLVSQLMDPFRIGLIIALIYTTFQTSAITGRLLPLAAGAVFVAAIIPMTMGTVVPMWQAVAVGVVANAIILAIALAGWTLFNRLRR